MLPVDWREMARMDCRGRYWWWLAKLSCTSAADACWQLDERRIEPMVAF